MSPLVVEGVSRTFRGKPPVTALRDVSFVVESGEVLGLLGANGAGKTTLIKILATLLLPTSGRALVCGHDVATAPARARAHLSVVLGGDRGLYERLSALDNLVFFAALHGVRRGVKKRALDALAQVGLAGRAHSRVETFSKGMRQRLHLASGLIVNTEVLLLDEPTIGLDIEEAQRIREVIKAIAADGTAVVLTSHYPVDIDALASRIILLQSGSVTHDLPVADFRRQTGYVAEVVVRGRGPLSNIPAAADCTVEGDETGWQLSFKVTDWGSGGLSQLTAVTSACDVLDVQVQPVGVEAVLTSLTRSATR